MSDSGVEPSPCPQKTGATVICVFCGSKEGTNPAHMAAARSLAHAMHAHSIQLVYGGGTGGLMGELARTLVSLSGPSAVHGVIPEVLIEYERAGRETKKPQPTIEESRYGRTTTVPDMHSRKRVMASEVLKGGPGSGFIALSGGYGTLEELMEITTWNHLGIHQAGIVLLNVDGFYDGLLGWIKNAIDGGFISKENTGIIQEAKEAEDAIKALSAYKVTDGRLNLNWNTMSEVKE